MKMLALYGRYLKAKDAIKSRLTDDEGQGLVEYVLIIVLIALVVLAAINPVTSGLQVAFSKISNALTSANAGS
jgi:Flp pilus assembly pilin Flp